MAITKGATVRLNSGGPLMTIREVQSDTVVCDWFDKDGRMRNAQFFSEEVKEDDKGETLAQLLQEIKQAKQA